jgi:hypothetical protein
MDLEIKAQYLSEIVRQAIVPNPLLHIFGHTGVGKTEIVRAAGVLLGTTAYLDTPRPDAPGVFPLEAMLDSLDQADVIVVDEPYAFDGVDACMDTLYRAATAKGKLLVVISQRDSDLDALKIEAEPVSVVNIGLRREEMRVSVASEWPDSYLEVPFTEEGEPRMVTSDEALVERVAQVINDARETLGVADPDAQV